MHRPTLDDVFLALTGRSLRDAEQTDASADAADPPEGDGRSTTTSDIPEGALR